MKLSILRIICLFACWFPFGLSAQIHGEFTSPDKLLTRARELFAQGNHAATLPLIREYIQLQPRAAGLYEADYMLACAAYELKDANRLQVLERHLDTYPDSPYGDRVRALMASVHFFDERYAEALSLFHASDLETLGNAERDDMTYRMAVSYLSTGNIAQAAIWFTMLRSISPRYGEDCAYYLAYIDYTQARHNEALEEFLSLQNSDKYATLTPYYIADIYLQQKQYDKATAVAREYLATPQADAPGNAYTAQMHRILGEVHYRKEDYANALVHLNNYMAGVERPQRSTLYMQGIAYYRTGVYSKAAAALGEVIKVNDDLTQNAYLHLGLSYLQLAEKDKARMAFEQAAATGTDMAVKEQASYNYALCIHETSFSAFGESVTVFERFLNEFPKSEYAGKVSAYLSDVYLTTRSYGSALKSIERIAKPNDQILGAKQRILFQLGTESFANAAFAEAATYFTRSVELGRYNRQLHAEACYWRGEAYYRLGDVSKATRDFTEYLRLNRQTNTEMYALAHYNLGYTAFHRKDYAAARTRFEQFVKHDQGTNTATLADAYNRIADCYLQTRAFDEAKQYYSQAEALDASAGDYSFYQLALVSGLQKDYAGKITILNRLAGKYPQSPYAVNALYEKGRSYVLMNNSGQAISAFSELLAKYPESPVARKAATEIGLLHYQAEDYPKAIEAYKHVIETYPGSEEARLAFRDLKSMHIDMNRVDEFAALTQNLPNMHFDVSEQDSLTYVAAEKQYMRGQMNQAKESFNKYLQSFPEGAFGLNAHYYLAIIGREQKNADMILQHSAKLLEYPNNPFTEEVLVARAEVLLSRQNYAEAMDAYRMLKEKASTAERRVLAGTGVLRTAFFLRNDDAIISAATDLLAESKLSPELVTEASYYRAKAYLRQNNAAAAMKDLKLLAKDTRSLFGAEAKYLVAEQLYAQGNNEAAEKELLSFIQQSTPHAYWLARGFVLLADVYVSMDKQLDARQYLLSLQQNYKADDDIQRMIETRLDKLNKQQ